jgi:hypothetical protein
MWEQQKRMFVNRYRHIALQEFFVAARNKLKRPVLNVKLTRTGKCRRSVSTLFLRCAAATAAVLWSGSPLSAQVVSPLTTSAPPPWSAETVFEPVPYAQLWSQDLSEPLAPEDTPVKNRQWPDYQPPGIVFHGWMFHPSISAGALFNSNVFASNTDQRADIAAIVNPSLTASSLWERNQLDFDAYVKSTEYDRYSSLDQTDASVRMKARIDVRHDIKVLINLRAANLHEEVGSLSTPASAISPTPYTYTYADVTYWQQFNRLSVSFGGRNETYNYGSTQAENGTTINQDSRDGTVSVAHGRVDYALLPDIGIFTAVEDNQRRLRGTPTQSLDSKGYQSLSGINFQLTSLIGGEIGLGYTTQNFDDPTIGTVSGPTYRALLTWSPTRSLDFRLKGEEFTTEVVDTVASAVRADTISLGADYELRRNLVLSATGTYENDKFFGETRRDNDYIATTSLNYLLNPYNSVGLKYKFIKRDSNLPASNYNQNEVEIDVSAQF